ncbi:MAG TPA: hypothetical protein VMP01_29660 [Pirellulaceae bacterium]|nr:hypothetical protein [Pirellulaceae bacterium]
MNDHLSPDHKIAKRWQFSVLDIIVCMVIVALAMASMFQTSYLAPWLLGLATYLLFRVFEKRGIPSEHPVLNALHAIWGGFVALTMCVPASLFLAATIAWVAGIRISLWHVLGGGAVVGVVLGIRFHRFFGQFGRWSAI